MKAPIEPYPALLSFPRCSSCGCPTSARVAAIIGAHVTYEPLCLLCFRAFRGVERPGFSLRLQLPTRTTPFDVAELVFGLAC